MGSTIDGSRVIITGGANGLGNEYAYYLLAKGAKTVAILNVDVKTGIEAVQKLNSLFGLNRAVSFPTDVSKPAKFEASFKKAVEYLGGLDIMINNAGILDEFRWNLMIDINIKGLIQGTLMAIDVMGKHKGGEGGTVINIASLASLRAAPYAPVYCATKHAIVGFSRSIALNFETTGIAVKTICPGPTDTFFMTNRAHRFLEFHDQDKAVEWMLSMARQKPEIVAEDVMRLIEEAQNGAIWINSVEFPTMSLDIPEFTHWGTPVRATGTE